MTDTILAGLQRITNSPAAWLHVSMLLSLIKCFFLLLIRLLHMYLNENPKSVSQNTCPVNLICSESPEPCKIWLLPCTKKRSWSSVVTRQLDVAMVRTCSDFAQISPGGSDRSHTSCWDGPSQWAAICLCWGYRVRTLPRKGLQRVYSQDISLCKNLINSVLLSDC